jgi:diaminohydroxyphosphoribosylaminopyrimidine deaminase/5-amino-6-(5-phosphoribosylamino)uracil reductase
VRRDEPRLDVRDPVLLEGRDQPWRIVISRRGRELPRHAPLFVDAHRHRTRVLEGTDMSAILREVVDQLGVHTLLLESGGGLAGAFLDEHLIDEVVAFAAPMLCGGDVCALGGAGEPEGVALSEVRFARFDDDVMMRACVDRADITKTPR